MPKKVGTPVESPAGLSLFQYTKATEDQVRISDLAVKDMTLDEKRLDEQHLVVESSLLDQETTICPHALVDCWASMFAFVDENLFRQHNFLLFKLKILHFLEVIERSPIESGDITQITRITYNIRNLSEILLPFVAKLGAIH